MEMYELYRKKISNILRERNNLIKNIALGSIVSVLTFLLILSLEKTKPIKLDKKDCWIAEISPDFTTKEKELCRELRRKK